MIAFDCQNRAQNRLRQNPETNSCARSEGLAVSTRVNNAFPMSGRSQGRRNRLAFETQFTIGSIFEQINGMSGISLVLSKQLEGSHFLFVTGRDRRWIRLIADQ